MNLLESNIDPQSTNQQIHDKLLDKFGITLHIKREDLLHPNVSGNKFRKLKYNLQEAKTQNHDTLLTFGGAYSNHIAATAAAGKKYGFKTIGIIRGNELGINIKKTLSENSTLQFAALQGMKLHFISRSIYREKESISFINELQNKFGNFYLIPEGGTNSMAIKGCQEILTVQDFNFDVICCSVGTGGTLSGLINAAKNHQKIIGFPALKENYLHTEITKNTIHSNWSLNRNYHFGKYAKTTPELIDFINSFSQKHKILLDPIYTGKLLFGIFKEIKLGNFSKKCRILAIHTGGLQGISGINSKLSKQKQTLINIYET